MTRAAPLPGLVNAHSHSFQRALRGRAAGGDFWAWREGMLAEAAAQTPETVLELLINKDKWDSLSDEQRTVLDTACRSTLLTTLAESSRLQSAALAELAKQGVRVETWSDELARAFRRAWEEVSSEESTRDPLFRAVLNDLEKFRAGPEVGGPTLPPMPPAP